MGILFLLFSNQLWAGWIISQITTDRFGNKTFHSTFVLKNLVRYESTMSVAILDLNHDKVTMIFPLDQAYWTGTPDELKKEIRSALLRKMEDFIAQVHKEDKEYYTNYFNALKKRLNSLDSITSRANIYFKIQNDHDTVSGYPAISYNVFLDSTLTERIWITDRVKPFSQTDLKKLMQTTAKMTPFNKEIIINNTEDYLSLIQNGVVLKTEKLIQGEVYSTTLVKQIKEGSIPDSFFEAPAGYRKISIMDVLDMSDGNLLPDLKTPFEKNNGPFKDY